MESESCKCYEKKKKKYRDIVSDDGDIPEPIRLCGDFFLGDEYLRRLLDYNTYLLCVGGIILLGIFLFT